MNGDANGTLGYNSPAQPHEMLGGTMGVGGGTFGHRNFELTVGGDSQSSRGRFNMKRVGA
jgi:hypothetical protein